MLHELRLSRLSPEPDQRTDRGARHCILDCEPCRLDDFFLFHFRKEPPDRFESQLATLIELIAAHPLAQRQELLASIDRAYPDFDLEFAPNAPSPSQAFAVFSPELKRFAHRLGASYRVIAFAREMPPDPGGAQRIAIGLPDGQFVAARLALMSPSAFLGPMTLTLIAIAFSVPLLCLWAALGLTRPLRRFVLAAENFNPSEEIAPVPEHGPQEIWVVARALNEMRERIKALIDDRTRVLVAVSHDLRTPITRLRLQCEFVDDEATRHKIRGELQHMESMVESVLHFLRTGNARMQTVALDLATSLQAISDQFADAGHDVSYHGPDHAAICANPEELHRAFTNLIDNAVRHGDKVDIKLALTSQTVTVTIEDDGPGIPDDSKQAMFEPFVRGDAARGMNGKIGFGLGLSIARTVIETHHGSLALLDRKPHGLAAQVTLPQVSGERAG
jgi:signal transduction histidine kinase